LLSIARVTAFGFDILSVKWRVHTMARDHDTGHSHEERPTEKHREHRVESGAWFTSTVLQATVATVGLVAVLFALSMALGIDLIGMLAEALSTQTGQWLAIAFVIILLTGAAIRALGYLRAPP
jgi:flagellar biosynthesis protein FlhB